MKNYKNGNPRCLYCLIVLCLILYIHCQKEKVPKPYRPSNAHDEYRLSLQQANLAETALGRDWIAVSQQVLDSPVMVVLPFEEAFYIDSTDAFALAYRFDVKRGQRIEVSVSIESRQSVRLFIEPRRDADYVIRLQPELLRGGRCRVIIRKVASLAFPVPKRDHRSILSFFGDIRDGGRREHHGVDIFAPRHTPIIAPSEATVRYVGESGIGGNVIWLWDTKRFLYYYFAHLQNFSVEKNDHVKTGQTIGTIGNSGNARTTSPHLHFGIYARGSGPVDPYYFITKTDTVTDVISADPEPIGNWVRTNASAVSLNSSTGSRLRQRAPLDRHTPMQVLAAARELYRVRLPDGISGYVDAHRVESIEEPLQYLSAGTPLTIRDTPQENSIAVKWITSGENLSILGTYNGHWFVREQGGTRGWISRTSTINPSLSTQGSSK